MRRRYLSFDVWACLALSFLISLGPAKITETVAQKSYEAHLEEHQAVDGEIGGKAGEEVFRAETVEDLLSHDTFTVISPGIEYRNRGAGYYGGRYFSALTLPSGEIVAAWINGDGIQQIGEDYYSSDKILPVGRVVMEDLTSSETFLDQIEYVEPLSRRDFYVDMVGDTAVMSEEQAIETPTTLVQVITVFICFPLLHALGSKIGIFPAYFSFKKKKKSEWE